MTATNPSPIMAALEKFEAAEANLAKLEALAGELAGLRSGGINFGPSPEYEDRARSFGLLLEALPKIEGWKPTATPPDFGDIAQGRLDAMEVDEPSAHMAIENWINEPDRELREYRFRLNTQRRKLIRDALVGLIDDVDEDLRILRVRASEFPDDERAHQIEPEHWEALAAHIKQVDTLLGSSVERPGRWRELRRHMHFGYDSDLNDIERMDWPNVKAGLRKSLYGENEPIPVGVDDLAEVVAAKPTGAVASGLSWSNLSDDGFERLIFALISTTQGYENPEWLMKTRAPDRSRDLSVYRVIVDDLSGTERRRVVIQCKHWLTKSVGVLDASEAVAHMDTWNTPPVDELIIATSGRFTADAVTWIEKHNDKGVRPRVVMWPESRLEMLLAKRPALIAEFSLR
jgi:hypothetical protein